MNFKTYYKLIFVAFLGLILFAFPTVKHVEAATATNNGSIFTTGASPFGGAVGWTNVANVQTSNSVYAVTSSTMDNATTANSYSLEILSTGFGFAIPANALINSITVGIQSKTSNGATPVYAYVPRIIVGGAESTVTGGSIYNINATPAYINYTYANNSSAGVSNLPVTVAQVNASNFGVAWTIYSQSATATTVSVDHVYITVDYTVPAAPAPVTDSTIYSIRSTDAVLTGTVNPNALSTTAYFKWSTSSNTCSGLTGSNSSATPATIPATGATTWPVTFPATGLSAGTTYYYCIVATNSSGTNYGNVYQFTTTGSATPGSLQSSSAQSSSSTNVTGVGTYNAVYSSPNNIFANDGVFTTCGPMNYPTNNFYCSYLWTWGYGFAIPANATITGIVVDLKGNGGTTAGVFDNMNLQLFKNAQSQTGYTGQRFPNLSTINQYIVAGSSNDLWGGTFTPAEINSATFGFMITNNSTGTWTESLDHFRVTVYYTLPTTPTLTTPTSSLITGNSVTLGGTITSQGGSAVTARGVCYSVTSTNANPQIGGSGVTCTPEGGTAVSAFTMSVSGLTPNTGYSYTAYATNTQGTGYTSASTFSTLNVAPTTVGTATNGTPQSYYVQLNGQANPNGYPTLGHFRVFTANPSNCNTDSGGTRFPAGTTSFPDIDLGSGTSLITNVTTPAFTYTIPFNSGSFLVPNTTYYYCAYAINTVNATNYTTGASGVVTFTTPDGPSSPCDPPSSGNLTIPSGAACNFNGTFNGVDAGTGARNTGVLGISSGVQLSISAGQTLGLGSMTLAKGSVLTLARGSLIKFGPIYVHDKDGDNYLDDATQYVGSTASASTEFIRRSLISSIFNYSWKIASSGATYDCNNNSAYAYRIIPNLVRDADNDGYKTLTAAAPSCVGASGIFNGRLYYNDGSGPN